MNIFLTLGKSLMVCGITLFMQSIYVALAATTTYRTHTGKQYLLNPSEVYNWYEARLECSLHKAQLVVLDSQENNLLIATILEKGFVKSNNLWINGKTLPRRYKEADNENMKFYWHPLVQPLSYTQWDSNQTLGISAEEQCIYLAGNTNPPYRWRYNSCHNFKSGYICELSEELRVLKSQVNRNDHNEFDELSQDLQTIGNYTRTWKNIIKKAMRSIRINIVKSWFSVENIIAKFRGSKEQEV